MTSFQCSSFQVFIQTGNALAKYSRKPLEVRFQKKIFSLNMEKAILCKKILGYLIGKDSLEASYEEALREC